MFKPQIKVCGITRWDDANAAQDLGAWGLGINLIPGDPRACPPKVAGKIARRMDNELELVGIFQNAPIDQVEELADDFRLSLLQLNGEETPEYCEEVKQRTGCKVAKRLVVRSLEQIQDRGRFPTAFHILDSPAEGEMWNWGLLRDQRSKTPFVLSGGIDVEMVMKAAPFIRPWAVNLLPEVESSPGIKDEKKMKGLFRQLDKAWDAMDAEMELTKEERGWWLDFGILQDGEA